MKTVCQVCLHHCALEPGQTGVCGGRKNADGTVVCENYGRITSLALDPVEKKPLRRFYPGSRILSVGSYGCNLRCPFCQNHEISMLPMAGKEERHSGQAAGKGKETCKRPGWRFFSARELAELARAYEGDGNIGVAFTYNEPLIGWEYVRDTAELVKAYGMKTVLVTNGTAEPWVLEDLLPLTDAMNIDLKGFQESYYRKLGGSLEAVKGFIGRAQEKCHVELTTLIVPGENDSEAKMREEAKWIASLDKAIPLHVTRFFPRYHMTDREATEIRWVHHLAKTAEEFLSYVYVGNC